MTLLVAGHSALLSRKVATKTAEPRERNRESEWVNQIVRAVSASIELRVVLAEATHGVMRLSELDSGVLSSGGHWPEQCSERPVTLFIRPSNLRVLKK